jgi:eukaryotic-like serine/threonine-protein kinase
MAERKTVGKYILEREIGRGGMGVIWEALDQQLKRKVALKIMTADPRHRASALRRFEREAMAVAQLSSANVVQIFDYGIEAGSPYIAMERLFGEGLDERLRRARRLSIPNAIAIFKQAARALEDAHAAGIVHRDIKPGNVFLASSGADEIVKILDFGIVSMLAEPRDTARITNADTLVGTPSYMSPEQVRNGRIDPRSDLWSLAVVMFEALTGERPFHGESLGDLILKICIDPNPAATSVAPDLPPEVDAFFDRALAKNPAQRFATAREMMAAFSMLGEPGRKRTAKILVVDDEPDVPLLVKRRFRRQIRQAVYDFIFATDGESALDELRRHPDVDAIVTDINMPKMDGLTFLGRVGEVNREVRTVIVSAYGDMTNIRTAMNRGAFDFLVKPINFEDLEVTIEKTIRHVEELRRSARSSRENEILRMFVSPRLLTRAQSGDMAEILTGEVIEVTIAAIHVHGFRGASGDDAAPDGLLRLLNANFEVIVPEIVARSGLLNRFDGHEAVAIFHGPDHTARALDACVAVRSGLDAVAAHAGQGSPYALGVSIGVDTGRVVEGGVGSRAFSRLDYTFFGRHVSAATELARLGGPGEIHVTESIRKAAPGQFAFDPISAQPKSSRLQNVIVVHRLDGDVLDRVSMSEATTLPYEEGHTEDGAVK